MARPSSREQILDALVRLILDRGAGSVTFDALAAASGVSKGGLLYHFASKGELFDGLLDRLDESVARGIADPPAAPAELLRWFFAGALSGSEDDDLLWRAMIAAVGVLDARQEARFVELVDRFRAPLHALDPIVAEQVRLIGDGLFFNALIGGPVPDAETIGRMVERLTESP